MFGFNFENCMRFVYNSDKGATDLQTKLKPYSSKGQDSVCQSFILKNSNSIVFIKVGEVRVVAKWITAQTHRARTMVHVYRGRTRTTVAVRTALWVCRFLNYLNNNFFLW